MAQEQGCPVGEVVVDRRIVRHVKRWKAGAFLGICALATACGSTSSTPSYADTHTAQQIIGDASASTGAATTFHLSIDATTPQGEATADFDIQGTNVSGKLTAQGLTIRITHVGSETFVYGADLAAILQSSNAQAAAKIKAKASDKWILMPADFWPSTGIDALTAFQKMTSCFTTAAGLVKKGTIPVSGRTAILIEDTAFSRLYVDPEPPHYFMRIDVNSSEKCLTDTSVSAETTVLTKVGSDLQVSAPSGFVSLASVVG